MFTLSTQLQAYQLAYTIAGRLIEQLQTDWLHNLLATVRQLAYTIAGRLIYFVYTIADRLIDQLPCNIADRLLHFDYSTCLRLLDILSASKIFFQSNFIFHLPEKNLPRIFQPVKVKCSDTFWNDDMKIKQLACNCSTDRSIQPTCNITCRLITQLQTDWLHILLATVQQLACNIANRSIHFDQTTCLQHCRQINSLWSNNLLATVRHLVCIENIFSK